MPIDFSIAGQVAQQNTRATEMQATVAQTGSLMGQQAVVVDSPMSLLADAAEELGFAMDMTDEFELEQRKEKDKTNKALAEMLQRYQELMGQAGKTQEMQNFIKSLRHSTSHESVLQQAQRFFPDPSDAWAALNNALSALEQEQDSSPEMLQEIQQAIEELYDKKGEQIRAGIQGMLAAPEYVDIGAADKLRELYRGTVCEFGSVSDVFKHVHEQYSNVGFARAMDFLFGALGADIAADVPSMGRAHLESVHSKLGQVRLLQSAHTLCENLLHRWEHVHTITTARHQGFDSMALLADVVGLREERFLAALHVERIAAKAGAPDIEREVLFLQEMLAMARSFPVQLFDGEEGRMKVLDAVQQAVDNAIAREDDYLASLE